MNVKAYEIDMVLVIANFSQTWNSSFDFIVLSKKALAINAVIEMLC